MRVVVTGGAGDIGSVVVETLLAERHDVTVYDDLSTAPKDPYGETKLAFERALAWYEGAGGARSPSSSRPPPGAGPA